MGRGRGCRQWAGDSDRSSGKNLRSLLHHESPRGGSGPGAQHQSRHCGGEAPRTDLGLLEAGCTPTLALGLLLAEQKNYSEAAEYLQKAAEGLPQRARVHYNLGQLLAFLHKDRQAEEALSRALQLEPGNMDYLSAMADFYVRREDYKKAEWIAEQMIEEHPTNRTGHQLLSFLKTRRKQID